MTAWVISGSSLHSDPQPLARLWTLDFGLWTLDLPLAPYTLDKPAHSWKAREVFLNCQKRYEIDQSALSTRIRANSNLWHVEPSRARCLRRFSCRDGLRPEFVRQLRGQANQPGAAFAGWHAVVRRQHD